MRTEKDVLRAWEANEALLRGRIHPLVIEPLSQPPGFSTEVDWDYILATSLAVCFDTFRAVQTLCSPNAEARLWTDGYILSRSIFEVSVTLDWCKKASGNLQRFVDDYHLLVARKLETLPDARRAEVRPERLAQIKARETTVLQKYDRGPRTMSVMKSLEQMCRELSEGEKEPNKLWEYNNYYREVSSFAHPTMWHLFSYRSKLTPITEVAPSPEIGYRALLISGGCFLRILQQWNELFKRLPDSQPYEWQKEWEFLLPVAKPSR